MASDEQQPQVTLHWLNRSRSQSLLWLLEELKVKFDIKLYHRTEQGLAPPELEKVHPLGKSPVVVIKPPPPPSGDAQQQEPIVLAESGHMAQYLCEHFPEGRRLVPHKWKPGMEGKFGGETEAWLRNQYFLHYSEGSLMPYLLLSLVIGKLKQPPVPIFIRPITSAVANRILSSYIFPNVHRHFAFLDQQLRTSGGRYLCCDHLTPADIVLSFPLFEARGSLDGMGAWRGGSWAAEFPRVREYIDLLQSEDGYKRSTETIKRLEGNADEAAPAKM
ncbi:glutathione transferase [Trichoderma citrinoviride]|uniref:Glutathione transferase n=1 Tax=Trichoderma citrinoviride TaxID=58853 RepID=A0A2T4BB53_9HYPO|nr:glutathione transferase [Trichoderma citrinoviride]PTB66547.1 glutathione transferase [Trichoderma citrinoviride]